MSKVIYTAENARYMVQARLVYYDWSMGRSLGEWLDEQSFRNFPEAVEHAAEEKRKNPYNEYLVVDTQAEEDSDV